MPVPAASVYRLAFVRAATAAAVPTTPPPRAAHAQPPPPTTSSAPAADPRLPLPPQPAATSARRPCRMVDKNSPELRELLARQREYNQRRKQSGGNGAASHHQADDTTRQRRTTTTTTTAEVVVEPTLAAQTAATRPAISCPPPPVAAAATSTTAVVAAVAQSPANCHRPTLRQQSASSTSIEFISCDDAPLVATSTAPTTAATSITIGSSIESQRLVAVAATPTPTGDDGVVEIKIEDPIAVAAQSPANCDRPAALQRECVTEKSGCPSTGLGI